MYATSLSYSNLLSQAYVGLFYMAPDKSQF